MSTKAMYDLKETLCTDLDQYAKKGTLSKADLDIVHVITDTVKNIDKITAMDEEGYSYGEWNAYGTYPDMRNSGRRYSRGNADYSNRHYSGNNYSNDSNDMDRVENRMRREMY